mmetsp:Transcript_14496/g.41768  ORF Transcript_14496/g.41768 Transcript_14496/m.41768 type:complete len:206 (-) Transcript_14496:354-971(-)
MRDLKCEAGSTGIHHECVELANVLHAAQRLHPLPLEMHPQFLQPHTTGPEQRLQPVQVSCRARKQIQLPEALENDEVGHLLERADQLVDDQTVLDEMSEVSRLAHPLGGRCVARRHDGGKLKQLQDREHPSSLLRHRQPDVSVPIDAHPLQPWEDLPPPRRRHSSRGHSVPRTCDLEGPQCSSSAFQQHNEAGHIPLRNADGRPR